MKDPANALTSVLSFLIFVLFISFIVYWFLIREQLAMHHLEKEVQKEALNGNRVAIELLKSPYRRISYEKRDLIYAALKGNASAIEVLGINGNKTDTP